MLESFSYAPPGSTGLFTTTLLGEEMSGNERVAVARARIGAATITLQNEADGSYINERHPADYPNSGDPAGGKHVIVASGSPGAIVGTADVSIDATTGALAWRWMAADTAVTNQSMIDVAEYLATIEVTHADTTATTTFDRKIIAKHRIRIPVRPALCVPADVFAQLGGFTRASEELLPLVEWCCEAVTDRFEEEYRRLVRKRQDTEYLYVDDDCTYALNLRRFPLDSIISVKESTSGSATPEAFADLEPLDLSGFLPALSDVGQIGVLRRRSTPFLPNSIVEVKYSGGIARATGDVPPSLRNAARRFAAFLVKHADKVGITSITAKDSSTTLYATDMPKDVQAVFETFRRFV